MNEEAPNSGFPESSTQNQLKPWPFYIGWCGFFMLFFAKLFSHTEALSNLGSGLMLISLIWFRVILPPDKELLRLRLLLYAFMIAGLISSVLPNAGYPGFMSDSFSSLRNTAQGGIGAFLTFYLIKDRRLTSTILHLLAFTVGVVCISAVMQWALLSENMTRLAGTKININRFAILLFPTAVPVWILLSRSSIRGNLDKKLFTRLSFPLMLLVPCLYIISVLRGRTENINTANIYVCLIPIIICAGIIRQLLSSAGRRSSAVLAVILVLQVSVLFLTGSRGAAISLVVLSAILGLGWLRTGITKKKVIACAFILVFTGVIFSLFWHRALVGLSNEREFNARLIIWRGTISLVRERPVFGIGYGDSAFRYRWPKESITAQEYKRWRLVDTWTPYHTHNLPLHYLAGGGITGLVIFVLFVFSLAWLFVKALTSPARERAWTGLFGLALMAAMLVQGLVMNPLRAENELLYFLAFGLLLALCCSGGKDNKAEQNAEVKG